MRVKKNCIRKWKASFSTRLPPLLSHHQPLLGLQTKIPSWIEQLMNSRPAMPKVSDLASPHHFDLKHQLSEEKVSNRERRWPGRGLSKVLTRLSELWHRLRGNRKRLLPIDDQNGKLAFDIGWTFTLPKLLPAREAAFMEFGHFTVWFKMWNFAKL